jgi:hypothetical protein
MSEHPYVRLRPSGEFAELLSEVRSRYIGTASLRIDEFGVELVNRGVTFDRVRRSKDEDMIEFVSIFCNMAFKLEIPISWDGKVARLYTKHEVEQELESDEGWRLDSLITIVALNPQTQ